MTDAGVGSWFQDRPRQEAEDRASQGCAWASPGTNYPPQWPHRTD